MQHVSGNDNENSTKSTPSNLSQMGFVVQHNIYGNKIRQSTTV